jgi:hypothetical protein
MSRIQWNARNVEKLLGCQAEEDLLREFPGQKISSLQRKQRSLRQNGNPDKKPEVDPKDRLVDKAREKELKRLMRKNTLYEVIGEQLIEATKAIPAGPIPKKIRVSKSDFREEEMCMLFGDCHVGLTVDSTESGGLGSYNVNVFRKEMEFMKESQAKVFALHDNVPYNTMNIFMLGDLIENRIMRESQLRLTGVNVVQQVMEAVNEISLWLAWVAQRFNQVNVYGVVGNHGRLTQKIGVLAPTDSMDYLVYKWLEERLRNYKNVKFNISESWWMAIERMNVKFYMEHGEEFRSWIGIPFYGLKRGKANMRELLRQYLDEKGRQVDFDYFLVGHIHTPSEFQGVLTNGAFPGGDEYSLKRLKLGELPSQTMFSIHPKFKKTWTRHIALKDPNKQPKVRFYN